MTDRRPATDRGVDTGVPANAGPERSIDADDVAAYLRTHPTFLQDNPELIDVLAPPSRSADTVVDMQHFMLQRLRAENQRLHDLYAGLVSTARDNQSAIGRTHDASLVIIGASSFESLIQAVTHELAIRLDVDVVTICVEAEETNVPRAYAAGVRALPDGMIDRLIGTSRDVALAADVQGDPRVFGAAAGLVRSQALARMTISPTAPRGLLALGSRNPETFGPGQGTELLAYLVRVLEITMRQWLNLPA